MRHIQVSHTSVTDFFHESGTVSLNVNTSDVTMCKVKLSLKHRSNCDQMTFPVHCYRYQIKLHPSCLGD